MSDTRDKYSFKAVLYKYIPEVIVIFLGISISFWFDEWRDNRKDREIEREILLNMKANLAQDTTVLGGTAEMGESLLRSINKLIVFKKDTEIVDSVSLLIDMAASYLGCPTNQTTYEEIKQTGHTSLILNDTLKRAILGHYTSVIPFAKEWAEVDKTHTMTQLIPEMSNYFPVVIDSTGMVSASQKVKFLKTPKLKHLLLTNLTYKKEAIKALNFANTNSKRLILRIDKALKNK
jgi:hypothetical protein